MGAEAMNGDGFGIGGTATGRRLALLGASSPPGTTATFLTWRLIALHAMKR